jgi:hypothetical protein
MAKKVVLYHQKLARLVQGWKFGMETLRAIVRIGQFSTIEGLIDAVESDNIGLTLESRQATRLKNQFLKWGIIFYDTESTSYFTTTLAVAIIREEDEVYIDWLSPACLALSIIMESKPGTDLVQSLQEELHLDKHQAEVVLSTLKSLPWFNKE